MTAPAGLRLDRVACLRGDRLLFEDVSATLGPGEAILVVGPNGVGKSSLLRVAAGLLPVAAGRVERSGGVALADEALALDLRQPLGVALGFWAAVDNKAASSVAGALERLGIAHLAEVPVRMLSTGQRKRATLARVLASGAALWLLDEPANGLDAAACARLADIMAEHRAGGGAILAATHQPLGLQDARELRLAA